MRCRRNNFANASSVSLFPRPRIRDIISDRFFLVKTPANSIHIRAETITCFVNNYAVGMDSNGNNVFLYRHGIFKLTLSVKELLKPCHLIIYDLFLRLQLGFKNHIAILVADDRHWTLAESINVNAVAIAQLG